MNTERALSGIRILDLTQFEAWPGGVNLVALGADHLFARWREDAYMLAMLRALDVAVRRHGSASIGRR